LANFFGKQIFGALSENAGWSKKESDSEWQHKIVAKEGPHLRVFESCLQPDLGTISIVKV
jgi:hypothetical protein